MGKINAMKAYIYKHEGGSCTYNGISARYDEILYACPDGYIELDEENLPENFCVLVKRELWGEKHYYFAPKKLVDAHKWVMFGGTLIYDCDARYAQTIEERFCMPLQLHDRVE